MLARYVRQSGDASVLDETTHYLEASLLAMTEFGGVGRPLTLDAILHSFFSTKSSDAYP